MWRNAPGAVLLGIAVTACAADPNASGRDSAGWLSCRAWRTLSSDADVLNDAEFRGRLQQLEAQARYASTPGFAVAVRSVLRASTRGNVAAAKADIEFVTRTCLAPEMR